MEEKKETHTPLITESTAEEIENVFEDKERESEEKVEAALFIAGRFLEIQELIMLTDVNPTMIREILHRLEKKYNKNPGVLRITNRKDSWKMDISEKKIIKK